MHHLSEISLFDTCHDPKNSLENIGHQQNYWPSGVQIIDAERFAQQIKQGIDEQCVPKKHQKNIERFAFNAGDNFRIHESEQLACYCFC